MKEEKMCRVKIGDEERQYIAGTSYQQIAEEFRDRYDNDIVLAYVNGKLQELRKEVKSDCTLDFETTAGAIGHETYKRSMSLLLVKSIYDVYSREKIQKVRIHFSVSKGYYCTVDGNVPLDQEFVSKVEGRMRELAQKDIPIDKRSVGTDEAVALFHRHGMYDKEKLFEYRRVSRVNIYNMNEFEDYFYGYMVPSAGYLKYFSIHLYDEGFVLQMPVRRDPARVPEFVPQNKLFQVLKEATKWGDMQGIEMVGALNDKVTKGDVQELVLVQEALQEKKIAEIASKIAAR